MIDRGALLLRRGDGGYRGPWRPPLDAVSRGAPPALRRVVDDYRAALLLGDGVLEDLDEAVALRDRARAAGATDVELVVFEAPQPAAPGALPVASDAPAEGLAFAGWDVIEAIEPWCSTLRDATNPLPRNAFGLLDDRAAAEAIAREANAAGPEDELVAVRVWLAEP